MIETGETTVNVIVVHLSYEKTQQCGNAEEILQYIKGMSAKQILYLLLSIKQKQSHLLTFEEF